MPLVSWKPYQKKRPDEVSVLAWNNTKHNVGVVTGHVSELLVVDVDGEYPADWPEMPNTWTVKTKKGFHYYFFLQCDMEFRNSARIAENVDIRSNGGYVVAPPSVHPDGGNYEWLDGKSPWQTKIANIPDWLIKILTAHDKRIFNGDDAAKVDVKPAPTYISGDNDAYVQAAIDAECALLQSAGAGTRNDQLNKSAFALAGLLPDHKVVEILTPVAMSIGLNAVETQKTIKSGCDSATKREVPEKRADFMPSPESPNPDDDMPLIVKNILNRQGKTINHSEIAPHLIENAPGMLGVFIRYVLNTSLYPQPTLALAAAIACIGTIMAHRVSTETDLRTNFFTMGIAESGAGKEHARDCIRALFEATGLSDSALGDPASAAAVIKAVSRAGGRAIMQIDEMGRFLESLKGGNAASHNKQTTTNMMHMYNSAKRMFIGQEYSDNEANGGRADIDQPCLNIYGTTVPHRFYNSLTSEEAYDGFLSRWLVFETTRFDIEPRQCDDVNDVPKQLIELVKHWQEHPTFHGVGDLGGYTMIKPKVVPFSDEARTAFYDLIRECRTKMANSNDPIEKAFWNRTAEHAAKLSLVAHDGDCIKPETFAWAAELSKSLTIATISNIKANVSDNAYEADLQKLLKMIKVAGGMTKSEVTRGSKSMDRRKRQDILDSLVEGGDLIETKETPEGGKKPLTRYRPSKNA